MPARPVIGVRSKWQVALCLDGHPWYWGLHLATIASFFAFCNFFPSFLFLSLQTFTVSRCQMYKLYKCFESVARYPATIVESRMTVK